MAMRMSGLMSGMDTESIVQQLVEAKSKKVTTVKNDKTKLEWKQDIWKGLNTKLKTLQSKLNDLRFSSGYAKKVTKSSDESIATVLTGEGAVNGVHTLEVNRLAKTAYMTSRQVSRMDGREIDITKTRMDDLLEFAPGEKKNVTLHKADGSQTVIDLTPETTVSEFVSKLKAEGLNASFDTKQSRFYISSKESGKAGNFMLTGDANALSALGLSMNQTASDGPKWLDGDPNGERGNIRGSSRLDQLIDFSKSSITMPDGSNARALNYTLADGTTGMITLQSFTRNENGVRHFTTVDDFVKELQGLGIDAAFDPIQQRFTIGDGVKLEGDEIWGQDEHGDPAVVGRETDVLESLGLQGIDGRTSHTGTTYVSGQDAAITVDGAYYTNTNNSFEINGLTITAQNVTEPGKSVTLNTQQDTDGIYDMVKDFLKSYNEVINEIDKLYNGESAKGYEPLTDAEKEAMSEKEVEKYEQKIKDSLLRRDSNLSKIGNALKKIMLTGFSVPGQEKKMYLSNFGIGTLSYFTAPDNERNAYHIDGDKDDTSVSGNEDKLKSLIASDPDAVVSFFSQLTQSLYTEMNEQSASVEGYRSFGSFYDDKRIKTDYDDYKSKIKEEEKKLASYEDKWYKKFAAMETAMAKMQQSASAVTSLLGG